MADAQVKHNFSEYTEAEFVELLEALCREDREADNDDRADLLLLHFEKVSGHPAGSDLIYFPEPGADSSPEGVMQIVKDWRAAHGMPGFKDA
ncbi:bacteriocin immunity protein [Pseudomonas sp. MWU16-30323]|jgi:hypothetical protein|uniref:bacteriocin immunity protein n=1 Tax=Pseudomonas sp. MWU16-30323 TaxID=2878094 RepID=UPI001CFA9DB9|nr:bacteriocin immunity protein [Pseudomonas sp. MWU16-30323]